MAMLRPITTAHEVIQNLREYSETIYNLEYLDFRSRELLKETTRRDGNWMAARVHLRRWICAPAKFAGWADITVVRYLQNYNYIDESRALEAISKVCDRRDGNNLDNGQIIDEINRMLTLAGGSNFVTENTSLSVISVPSAIDPETMNYALMEMQLGIRSRQS